MLQSVALAVKEAMRSKGYLVFGNEQKGYDLNLVGIRTNDLNANTFNDHFVVMYLYEGRWCLFDLPCTTDPGLYWREHPMNVNGTAILKPGQYRSAYSIGEHKGYPALVQRVELPVYRDDNHNPLLEPDESTVERGYFGINIHRASSKHASTQVDKWSAGCQVIADPYHFEFLMMLCRKSVALFSNAFTYTLLTEDDIPEISAS